LHEAGMGVVPNHGRRSLPAEPDRRGHPCETRPLAWPAYERGDMNEAYIVDAVRTPVGKRNGGLSKVHPADLGAHSIKALFDRVDVDPAAVDDVVFGCVDT